MQEECSGDIDMLVMGETVEGEQAYDEVENTDPENLGGAIYLPSMCQEEPEG